MPELPEVETVRRGLAPALVGATIERVEARRPDLRFPLPKRFVERLEGQAVLSLDRRAKYLVAPLSSGEALVMHLGMTGRFVVEDGQGRHDPGLFYAGAGGNPVHDHVVFHLSNGARVTYNDARRFGFMDVVPGDLTASRHFARMGMEPLSETLDGPTLAGLLRGKAPIKAALLDQRVLAGLGNIYVCEALHRAGLSPTRAAGSLDAGEADRLALAIRAVLTEAVEAGGSTLRDYRQPDGSSGGFQHRFRVYDRVGDPCPAPGCGGQVGRIVQGGRSTFFCETCQR